MYMQVLLQRSDAEETGKFKTSACVYCLSAPVRLCNNQDIESFAHALMDPSLQHPVPLAPGLSVHWPQAVVEQGPPRCLLCNAGSALLEACAKKLCCLQNEQLQQASRAPGNEQLAYVSGDASRPVAQRQEHNCGQRNKHDLLVAAARPGNARELLLKLGARRCAPPQPQRAWHRANAEHTCLECHSATQASPAEAALGFR